MNGLRESKIALLLCSLPPDLCPPKFRPRRTAIRRKHPLSAGDFCIAQDDTTASIYVDTNDYAGVLIAANNLCADVNRVTGHTPAMVNPEENPGTNVIIIGTIGKSRMIDGLIQAGKIDVSSISNQWESYFTQVVPHPLPGVASGLVIVGSDKRGTIYGIYDLSAEMGVSPWYWWADVPVPHQDAVFVKAGKYEQGPPAVKYRGIFLNDEGAGPDRMGEGKIRQLQPRVLHECLRTAVAVEGELPLAGDVEQLFQRRRSV